MSNSPLVVYTKISPFKSAPRNKAITKITPHHVAGNLTVESTGQVFQTPKRNASSNYGIGSDGRIGMYVEEKDRSWCSSSAANDNAALTIEVANNSGSPNWTVSAAAWEALVKLCVDMCQRNPGIKQKDGRPGIYCDDTPNASLTFHRYFSATGCAQPYIWNRRQQLCDEVNKRLGATGSVTPPTSSVKNDKIVTYTVKVTANVLNIRKGPGTNYGVNGSITDKGIYTIVEESNGPGAKKWGKLKSGAGWISLDYCQRR